jgi:hypothetical protein
VGERWAALGGGRHKTLRRKAVTHNSSLLLVCRGQCGLAKQQPPTQRPSTAQPRPLCLPFAPRAPSHMC